MRVVQVGPFVFRMGRNAAENDRLVRESHPDHIWFHLADHPSCHGVLNCTGREMTKHMRYVCGSQMKKNSRFRREDGVRINCTEVRHVGVTGTPGLVDLRCDPDEFAV